jgi:hypothetical protein
VPPIPREQARRDRIHSVRHRAAFYWNRGTFALTAGETGS